MGAPLGLVRNVPLSLRPLRRSWIGTDSDEYEGAEARGGVGACRGEGLGLAARGDVAGGELPSGETLVSPVSKERRSGTASWQRRASVESGDGGAGPEAGAGTGPEEVRRRD